MSFFRLRQSVAVKELINAKTKHLLPMGGQSIQGTANNSSPFMRKTVSVPNISHVSTYLTVGRKPLQSCITRRHFLELYVLGILQIVNSL
jgi:hypothetical protein